MFACATTDRASYIGSKGIVSQWVIAAASKIYAGITAKAPNAARGNQTPPIRHIFGKPTPYITRNA